MTTRLKSKEAADLVARVAELEAWEADLALREAVIATANAAHSSTKDKGESGRVNLHQSYLEVKAARRGLGNGRPPIKAKV